MKKIIYGFTIVILMIIMTASVCYSATKYDQFKDQSWKNISTIWENGTKHEILRNYLELFVTEDDIIQCSKGKNEEFTKEQRKFMRENSRTWYMLCQLYVVQWLAKINQSQRITDQQMVFFTAIIKDPKAQVAKNQMEYEIEKQFFRSHVLYVLWDSWQKDRSTILVMKNTFQEWDKQLK